jgi:hypothetical protein
MMHHQTASLDDLTPKLHVSAPHGDWKDAAGFRCEECGTTYYIPRNDGHPELCGLCEALRRNDACSR